jgi:ABC-type branched-subunit amino acid transport system ATPase component
MAAADDATSPDLLGAFARRHRLRAFEALPWLAAIAAYFVFPDYLALGAQLLATILFALSLDLVLGYAGIVTLGHAAFFGTGAYTAGILAANGWGEPISGLIAAATSAGAVGFCTGAVILRTSGLTLLMQTLVVAAMLSELANKATRITGGADGLQGMDVWPIFGTFRFDLFGRTAYIYSALVLLIGWLVVRSIVYSHACGGRAGAAPQARGLHDLGGTGGHFRRADRADGAIRRARSPRPGALRHPPDHAHHRRRRAALWRLHRRHPLHDRPGSLFHDRSGLLVFLDRPLYDFRGGLRARWRARPDRAGAAANPQVVMKKADLETQGLCKSFGVLPVASDINFRLEAGARHALIGPNGAGKTSFVNLVTGVLKPSAGRILLGGEDITHLSQAARVKLGLVRTFQISALFRRLSLIENVTLAIAERQGSARDLMRPAGRYRNVIEEAYALLQTLGLAADALRPVNELAYGRQRLADIAVSLGLKPKVLLLDEPAAGVPSGETGAIIDMIERLPSDIAFLIIEHDMDLVFRLANRITVLVQGSVLIEGAPREIAADAQVRQVYLGERNPR